MEFGEQLSNLLEAHSISQQSLSQELNISPSTLNGYLRNRRQPDYATLVRLAHYFGTSTDYLLGTTKLKDATEQYLTENEALLVDTFRLMSPSGQSYLLEESLLLLKHTTKDLPPNTELELPPAEDIEPLFPPQSSEESL